MFQEMIRKGKERGWLLEPEAKELCRGYGLSVGDWRVVNSRKDAENAGDELGYPLVMKIVSPDILHKSDVGGVILNIKDSQGAKEAYGKIEEIKTKTGCMLEGALVEQMAPPGVETIIGAKRDPQFGPVIMFGLGGIFVEVFKDIAFRVAPLTKYDAMDMISELKAYVILKGIRGKKPSDIDSIATTLMKVSEMMSSLEEIAELDFNPTIVYESGYKIVDARIILK
ncbi:MAG: acetate--CoA ligase family protein [Candidatus Methanomethylicus sp.]|nr:acetate--CoA ligase family protein [Candidatus Methanomethylicus sp.]